LDSGAAALVSDANQFAIAHRPMNKNLSNRSLMIVRGLRGSGAGHWAIGPLAGALDRRFEEAEQTVQHDPRH